MSINFNEPSFGPTVPEWALKPAEERLAMTKTLVIYHGPGCADGFGAAWAVRHALGEAGVEYLPAQYGDEPPDVSGRNVILVDFSYKRPVLLSMAEQATSILILDHHKTADEELVDLPENVLAVFDMERSGARMAWEYFCPDEPVPELLKRVEDRDLWRFRYAETREVMAAVFSYPQTFEVWDELMAIDLKVLQLEGKAIARAQDRQLRDLIAKQAHTLEIAGYSVPALNAPHYMASEAGNYLAVEAPFAAIYSDDGEFRQFSLRSVEGEVDVSEIARQFGGGGHKNAAGFRVMCPSIASSVLAMETSEYD